MSPTISGAGADGARLPTKRLAPDFDDREKQDGHEQARRDARREDVRDETAAHESNVIANIQLVTSVACSGDSVRIFIPASTVIRVVGVNRLLERSDDLRGLGR